MRGQVLGVDRRTGEGQIAGADGQRYVFTRDDWAHDSPPAIGATVDFSAEGTRALSLFPMPASSAPTAAVPAASDRNKLVAALLAFFLGTLGVDRFYLGRTGSGLIILVLSVTVVGMLVTAPLALVNFVRYLVMSDAEFAARYARIRP